MGKKSIIIIAIVVAALLVGVYFLINAKNKDNPKVISLTIDSVNVNVGDTNLNVTGTIDLLIDDEIYDGVSLEGYCLDTNNQKYSIYGPQDGRSLFHNGTSDLSLSEDIEKVSDVNWENVTIKYCKIDNMKAYKSKNDSITGLGKLAETKEFELNYEKSFN